MIGQSVRLMREIAAARLQGTIVHARSRRI